MFHQDSVIIIPARLASSRLPKKVLADINGLSMLSRVVKSALQANICDVVVATESEEVKKEVEKFNITTIIISTRILSHQITFLPLNV